MEHIIRNLLASDNEAIQKGTKDLKEAYEHPETIQALCDLTVMGSESQIRQYAVLLLRKRLAKKRYWRMVPSDQQNIIKHGMLGALMHEKDKSVRNTITQFVGVLVRHDSGRTAWMSDVLKFIYQHCASADPNESELGASIFAIVADIAPERFLPYMNSVCEMFNAALVATEACGNMATPVIYNILLGMAYLVPYVEGQRSIEQTYQNSIPLIIKSLRDFAILPNCEQFVKVFDILENVAEYVPKLLTAHIKLLLQFCLEASSNVHLDAAIRVRTVQYIGWLVKLKKKVIIRLKLVEPIVQSLFNLMANEPDFDDVGDDYYLGEENSQIMSAATQTLDLLAVNVPSEKLISCLLKLMEPALQSENPLPRRTAYLTMGVIADGCGDVICKKYLKLLLNTVKAGIADPVRLVKNSALFALEEFSDHLQPEVSKYASQVLPIFCEFLQQLCISLREGLPEPKHIYRMFYALETYCENLEDGLVPYLPQIMDRLIETLNINYSVRLQELSFATTTSVAHAVKEHMLPYMPALITLLQAYLPKTDNKDIIKVRPVAIDTLAALGWAIGTANFMPLATDSMNCALILLKDAKDPDLRRSLYNLFSALAMVVNQEMASVYPQIMDRIMKTVLSRDELMSKIGKNLVIESESDDDDKDDNADNNDDDNNSIEIDFEMSESDELDKNSEFCVENAFLDEKEEALCALKTFAEYTGIAFIPYLEKSFKNVMKLITHAQEDIRKSSIEALCAFVVALFRQNDIIGVTNAITLLLPKLLEIVNYDEEVYVVGTGLQGIATLLTEIKEMTMPTNEMREAIFKCINNVLLGKVSCQYNDLSGEDEIAEESEYDETIIEEAANLLSLFGHAMKPEEFFSYFQRIYITLLHKLKLTAKAFNTQRAIFYGALAKCFAPLQNYSMSYYDIFYPLLFRGVNDNFNDVRGNSILGLGEMVFYSKDKSFDNYPHLLQSLSNAIAKETEPIVLDNICGMIARLILTNYTLVPLPQVLPVLIRNLPLRENFEENKMIFRCFKFLYFKVRCSIIEYTEKILEIAIHVLYKKEYEGQETYDMALTLMKEIRDMWPDTFSKVANTNLEVTTFLKTL